MGDMPAGFEPAFFRAKGGNISALANTTPTLMPWTTEVEDALGMHTTSSANLTGTVAKTNGTKTLTGTGTLFTTELAVGDAIMVPGGANEFAVVQSIASNTSLTVYNGLIASSGATNFRNTASGQTARRANELAVCKSPGLYAITGGCVWASNTSNGRQLMLESTAFGGLAEQDVPGISGGVATLMTVGTVARLTWGEAVCLTGSQNTGGPLDWGLSDDRTFLSIAKLPG